MGIMVNPGTYSLQAKDMKEDLEKLRNKKWVHWKVIQCNIYPNITYTMFQKWNVLIHLVWTNNYLYHVSATLNMSFPNYSMLSFMPWMYLCYSLFVEMLLTSTYQTFITLIYYLCINLIFYNLLRVSNLCCSSLCFLLHSESCSFSTEEAYHLVEVTNFDKWSFELFITNCNDTIWKRTRHYISKAYGANRVKED